MSVLSYPIYRQDALSSYLGWPTPRSPLINTPFNHVVPPFLHVVSRLIPQSHSRPYQVHYVLQSWKFSQLTYHSPFVPCIHTTVIRFIYLIIGRRFPLHIVSELSDYSICLSRWFHMYSYTPVLSLSSLVRHAVSMLHSRINILSCKLLLNNVIVFSGAYLFYFSSHYSVIFIIF